MFEKIKKEKNDIDSKKKFCVKTDGAIFNFNKFKHSLDLTSDIYRNKSLLKNAENKQNELRILLNELKNYNPTNQKKIKTKEETLSAAEKMLNNRQEVINAFKTGIFLYIDGFQIREESEEEDKKLDENKLFKYIENESGGINYFFKTHFKFSVTTVLAKTLFETKNKNKNNDLVNLIKSGICDLKDKIDKMSEDEKEIEKPKKT